MSVDALIQKRGFIKARVTRLSNYFTSAKTKPLNETVRQLKLRLDTFKPSYEEFDKVQSDIESHDDSETQSLEREAFENQYFQLVSDIEQFIESHKTSNLDRASGTNNDVGTVSNNGNLQIKLPTIDLPKFNGSYSNWLAFYDSFEVLINQNLSLTDTQRFYYLQSCLTGEAKHVIESLSVSSENYNVAWKLLKERYENKRLIGQTHIRAIFNLPVMTKVSATGLRQLTDSVTANLNALKALGRSTDHWDDMLIYLIMSKLDFVTRREWELNLSPSEWPNMAQLNAFLKNRCHFLESMDSNKSEPRVPFKEKVTKTSMQISAAKNRNCFLCNREHRLFQCPDFLNLSTTERFNKVKELKLCTNCFASNHMVSNCKGRACIHCRKKHNSLLHINTPEPTANVVQSQSPDIEQPSTSSVSSHNCSAQSIICNVLLPTAMVKVYDQRENAHQIRILLDSGSQVNLITENLCKRLNLKSSRVNISITGVGQASTKVTNAAQIRFFSNHTPYNTTTSCFVVQKITDNLAISSQDLSGFKIPAKCILADPNFHKNSAIDLLVGCQLFWEILCAEQVKLGPDQPVLQNTQLGWVISGLVPTTVPPSVRTRNCNITRALEEQVLKFLECESVSCKQIKTAEECLCEEHFITTHSRSADGRFIVHLPFKPDVLQTLGSSKDIAIKRFKVLENKFRRHPQLRDDYVNFMEEYLSLGHMEPIVNDEQGTQDRSFYLPHHAVITKGPKKTSKIRVVFDGSAKSGNNLSLNDLLLKGPIIQQDLFAILTRFRIHKYVFTADIVKMYRQILLHPNDRDLQKIVWRSEANQPMQWFRLKTVTYGTTSASFLAIRSLQQLAYEEKDQFPLAHDVVLNDFYVDDVLTGANSEREILDLRDQLINMLKKGGFELSKWVFNNQSLSPQDYGPSVEQSLDKDGVAKTLGIFWKNCPDTINYSVKEQDLNINKITKRTILAVIAKLFDPLGLVGPILINAKIILQKLWSLKIDWEETLPIDLQSKWFDFIRDLSKLNMLKIPRRIISIQSPIQYEAHGFCDASELAYGACIYIRAINLHNEISSHLLCAKSRVAPLKSLSLPRLELCGALLLARLMHKVMETLQLNISKKMYWTDSTIVLAWITSPSRTWNTFVANRVGEIQTISDTANWRHVPSEKNPADIISRGATPNQLIRNNLWFHGPDYLNQDSELWPSATPSLSISVPERRTCFLSTKGRENNFILELINRFSHYYRLVRAVATLKKFVEYLRTKWNTLPISITDLKFATRMIIKAVQGTEFSDELNNLKKGQMVKHSSKLISLSPFLDSYGIIRVGGRLQNSNFRFENKHQIVLPKNHKLTQLIISAEHIKQLHAGPQATLASVRQRFWPLSGRDSVRKVLFKCIKCFKAKPIMEQPLMGNLPPSRVQPVRPFINSGVDYAGPIFIKESKGKRKNTVKAYVALFICLATKAIHLELVTDCTTETFLSALKRFMARRGKVSSMHSDNGTNFVGASRELNNLKKLFESQEFKSVVIKQLQNDNISWNFIPPRSPHFGGVWEAGVKSFKYHFKRIVGESVFTYEEMYTFLTLIESCLNSRPLTALSNDPSDLSFLTPGHFLIGESLTAPVEPDLMEIKLNRLSRWQLITRLKQHFWKRWSREYLGQLQRRTKWATSSDQRISIDALVLLHEENTPPLKWPIGRIVALHPGKDGIIRVVSVKTQSAGIVKRAVKKLSVLPMDTTNSAT